MVNLVCEAIIPDGPMKEVEEIENSIKTVYRKSIWNKFIKAINDYSLVEDGDKIAIGISGGKDSLLLAKLFSELKKDKSRNFEFKAVSLNPGFRQSDLDNFKNNHPSFRQNIRKFRTYRSAQLRTILLDINILCDLFFYSLASP